MYNQAKKYIYAARSQLENKPDEILQQQAEQYFLTLQKDTLKLLTAEGNLKTTEREKRSTSKTNTNRVTFKQFEKPKSTTKSSSNEEYPLSEESLLELLVDDTSSITISMDITSESSTDNIHGSLSPKHVKKKVSERSKESSPVKTHEIKSQEQKTMQTCFMDSQSFAKEKPAVTPLSTATTSIIRDFNVVSEAQQVLAEQPSDISKQKILPQSTMDEVATPFLGKLRSPFARNTSGSSDTSVVETVCSEEISIQEKSGKPEEFETTSVSSVSSKSTLCGHSSDSSTLKKLSSSTERSCSTDDKSTSFSSSRSLHKRRITNTAKENGSDNSLKSSNSNVYSTNSKQEALLCRRITTFSSTSPSSSYGTSLRHSMKSSHSNEREISSNFNTRTQKSESPASNSTKGSQKIQVENSSYGTPTEDEILSLTSWSTASNKNHPESSVLLSGIEKPERERSNSETAIGERKHISSSDNQSIRARTRGRYSSLTDKIEPRKPIEFFDLPLYHELYLRLLSGLPTAIDEKSAVAKVVRTHTSLLKSEIERELRALREWDRLMHDFEKRSNFISFKNLQRILRGYRYQI